MHKLTAQDIRSCFINATRSEVAKLSLPKNLESLPWDDGLPGVAR
jgi:hypothetical protein